MGYDYSYDEDYDRFYESEQYISLQEECLEEICSSMPAPANPEDEN